MSPTDPRYVFTDDGNQTLAVIEQEMNAALERRPEDYPKLTAAHLLGGLTAENIVDTRVATNIDALLSRSLRARASGAGIFKLFRDTNNVQIMFTIFEHGEASHGQSFIRMMKDTMVPNSLASGLTDLELGAAWEVYRHNVIHTARAGAAWRKKKDSRG